MDKETMEQLLYRTHSFSERASTVVDKGVRWACISLILFMTAEVIVAVFFRYALDAPIKWGEELARLLMVWAGLLGISIALKDGDHVGLEIMMRRLHGRPRLYCALLVHLIILPFLVVLLVWGVQISKAAWGTFLPALQIKWTWSHLAVPTTASIQLLHLLSRIIGTITDIVSSSSIQGRPSET